MNELVQHLETRNEYTQEWIDAAEGRWAGLIVTDPAHWAERDVYTVAQWERYMNVATYSDLHKEVYGCRGYLSDDMTDEEVVEALNSLHIHARQEAEWEENSLKEQEAWDERCLIEAMENYGIDRDTAARWDDQASWGYTFFEQSFNPANDTYYVLEEYMTVGVA